MMAEGVFHALTDVNTLKRKNEAMRRKKLAMQSKVKIKKPTSPTSPVAPVTPVLPVKSVKNPTKTPKIGGVIDSQSFSSSRAAAAVPAKKDNMKLSSGISSRSEKILADKGKGISKYFK